MSEILVQGGRVIDPADNIDITGDVLIRDGVIAGVGETLHASSDAEILDARGKVVVPGLFDMHVHTYVGVGPSGFDADLHCLPAGVTTVADGGSSGSATYAGFRDYVQLKARTRTYAFINLSYVGLVGGRPMGELLHDDWIDGDGAVALAAAHPDLIRGIKVRVDERAVEDRGHLAMAHARDAAAKADLPLMVHICGSRLSLAELLAYMKPGDIITHMMTARGEANLLRDDKSLQAAREARERGVIFDVAHGRSHFPWEYAERLLEADFLPDVISSDLAAWSLDKPVVDLVTTMNKFLLLGLPLPEVIAGVTSRPAAVLGVQDVVGNLRAGTEADVTVLEWSAAPVELWDTDGQARTMPKPLKVAAVFRAGKRV
ncbi:MAG: amidohydrolase family protein [Mycobacterium sp.]